MPNVCLAAGFRVAALISFSLIASAPASGQGYPGNPYDMNRVFGYSSRGLLELEESTTLLPDPWQQAPAGAGHRLSRCSAASALF